MKITLANCNNIDGGDIEIKENLLNIKYAINGTGKSTISKAILAFIKDKQDGTQTLNDLLPFKYMNVDYKRPELTGADNLTSVKVFDEDYVADHIYKPYELIEGSFDIFICDQKYEDGMKEIELLVEEVKAILSEDKDIEGLISDFNDLSTSFGKPTATGIHGGSIFSKAFKTGNKVANIPKELELFKDYIHYPNVVNWVQWQIKGKDFIDITENCPYCVTNIKDKKSVIRRVSDVYNPKNIENLTKIIAVFERLSAYFTDSTRDFIGSFIKNVNGYTNDEERYLNEVRLQIDDLKEKFSSAQRIGFSSLKDADKIVVELKNYQIDLRSYNHLQSKKTEEKVKIVNDSLTKLVSKAGELQGSINKQKRHIEELVEENKKEINSFLKSAGFEYSVDLIEDENGKHLLKLVRHDIENEVSNVKAHLSFGERNAFALVLFMFDAIKSNADLIILDDPISSFDKNKKYAIIDMLFHRQKYLRGRTVLMLTHDLTPLIDMMLHHPDRFYPPFSVFLENNKGSLTEKEILRNDIKTFIEIYRENIELQPNVLIKLVYLRRFYEVMAEKDNGWDIISSLLHKREFPTLLEGKIERLMTKEELAAGIKKIGKQISGFDYSSILDWVRNDSEMIKMYRTNCNNYEKLHIYRIIFDDKQEKIESDVVNKFINEAFHIENNYIYQLNPCKYQIVPQYIIEECNKYIDELEKAAIKGS